MEDFLVEGGSAIDPIGKKKGAQVPGALGGPMADGGSIIDPIGWGKASI